MRFLVLPALLPVAAACGPLGDPHPDPAPVVDLPKAVAVAAGGDVTCAVLDNGNGACWGIDQYGQLGGAEPAPATDGGTPASSVPRWVALDADPIAIAAGPRHGCAIVDGGQVRCWGAPGGFLGVTDEGCEAASGCVVPPTPVPGLAGIVAIAAGGPSPVEVLDPLGVTCVVTDDARALCWGDNRTGQLGGGDWPPLRAEPRQVLDDAGFPLRDVREVTIGASHACALAGSDVWCWGGAQWGEGGGGAYARRIDGLGPVIDVDAGRHHTCAVTGAREVICWGLNTNGQAGDWTGDTCVDGYQDCVRTPQRIAGVAPAVEVAAGDLHTCARTATGDVVCWGSNELGQTGDPDLWLEQPPRRVSLQGATAITAGEAHTCALLDTGAVWCWGDDDSGQLGRGGAS